MAGVNRLLHETAPRPQPEALHMMKQVNGVNAVNGHCKSTASRVNGHHGSTEHVSHEQAPAPSPIAIVGIGLKLPGNVTTTDGFWDLLVNKRSTSERTPDNRYSAQGFSSEFGLQGTLPHAFGHFVDCDLEQWDASFFSMSRAEVEKLDPQQRLLLQVIWECMDSGGQRSWRGRNIGCYVGVFGEDWLDLYAKDAQHLGVSRILGTNDFALANRASYEYDLKGPSMTIRTACSSSLTALHEACKAIHDGDCEGAIVAGTSLFLSPTMPVALQEQGVLSATGTCKSFDAAADGYARGEAINAVFIKKLDDAMRDGDPIRAVIRATATNFDGKTVGITNPDQDSHVRLMRRAYEVAGIKNPSDTAFVECHGTGTQVGDPTETEAVGRVFGHEGVYIGSVKPNIGHGEGASGLNSLIKSVLALEHETIPPNINFANPNPKIKWDQYKLRVPTEPTAWPEDRLARVSINCFGVGGANAHAIVESAKLYTHQPSSVMTEANGLELLLFSAHQAASVEERAHKTFEYTTRHQSRLADVAYTLGARRETLGHRAFAVIDGDAPRQLSPVVKSKAKPNVAFIFTGQGAQWAGMGADLMRYDSFARDIDDLDAGLQKLAYPPPWTIREELLRPQGESRLQQPEFSQPICTALQIALVNLLRSWGVRPSAVAGHSSGEMAAAYTAGVLTQYAAMAAAYYRGQMTQKYARVGAMAAVGLSRAEATGYLRAGVVVACDNSPSSVTLSGDVDAVDEALASIKSERPDCFVRKLRVERAYHSHHMSDIGQAYEKLLQGVVVAEGKPSIPFFSSVTAKQVKRAGVLGPAYWRDNLESPVLFTSAISLMLHAAPRETVYVEIGPHSALAGPLRDIFKSVSIQTGRSYLASLVRKEGATQAMLSCLGRLFQHGVAVDVAATTTGRTVLTDLPNYAWRKEQTYWSESRVIRQWRQRRFPPHELLGSRLLESDELEPSWRNMLRLDNVPWARHHKINQDVVLPAAAYIAMAVEAVRQLQGADHMDASLKDVDLTNALLLHESQAHELVTHLRPSWVRHCTGQVKPGRDVSAVTQNVAPQPRAVSTKGWYRTLAKIGLNYGPEFQGLTDMSAFPGRHTASASIANPDHAAGPYYPLHPRVIDLALQAFALAAAEGLGRQWHNLCVPTYLGELYVGNATQDMRLGVSAEASETGILRGSATIVNKNGQVALNLCQGELSPIQDADPQDSDMDHAAHLVWKADVDFVPPMNLIKPVRGDRDQLLMLEALAFMCSMQTLRRVEHLETSLHLQHLRSWLHDQRQQAMEGQLELVRDCDVLASLDDSTLADGIDAAMDQLRNSPLAEVAKLMKDLTASSEAIFRGEKEASEIQQKDACFKSIYELTNTRYDYKAYLELLGHANPTMKILEIGARTPGVTPCILDGLINSDGNRTYARYFYTSSSDEDFEVAKLQLKHHQNVDYKVLDINKDPFEQGFEASSFDLIIASNAISSACDVQQALKNTRKLLKDRGRLLVQELNPEFKMLNFVMGFYADWSKSSENDLPRQPFIQTSRWETELYDAGFSGNDCVMLDDAYPYHMGATIISTAASAGASDFSGSVSILCHNTEGPAKELHQVLDSAGFQVSFIGLDTEAVPDGDVISLLDLEEPFFYAMSSENLKGLQSFLQRFNVNRGMLWVTGLSQTNCSDPRYAPTIGASRNIRSELSIDWATVEIDPNCFDVEVVAIVFEKFRHRIKQVELDPDWEYALVGDVIMIPRFHWVKTHQVPAASTGSQTKTLEAARIGQLQTLQWVDKDDFGGDQLGDEQVVLEPRAVGLNFKDILVAMGIVEGYRPGLGIECAGIVRQVGSKVCNVVPGDRVMQTGHGCFSTTLVVDSSSLVKIPDSLSFEDAATVPCVYGTAIHALINLGGLRQGQTVLVHSACGGVGIAALNICRMVGAEVFATVGNSEKVQYLMDEFGLDRDHIFNSRDASFYHDLMAMTNGRGADLVLNSLSGELLHTSWKCVARFGKMLEIGKRDFIGRGQLDMNVFESNRSFHGIDMSQVAAERPQEFQRVLGQFVDFYKDGRLKPISPLTTFNSGEVIEAFRFMQKGQHIGKIVVRMPEDLDQDEVVLKTPRASFRADASYLLVGGFGGLGRAVATWMVQNGACHLAFLSRSAGDSDKDQQFMRELKAQGCTVQAIKGSVTDAHQVSDAMKRIHMPVAGVFLMTMVLRDRGLLQLTHDDWFSAADPKIKGALNLHEALTEVDLDFFILFSSISYVVGQIGQANYSAANSYLAAFTQMRHSMGLPAAVLNVGVMDDVGYVVENEALLDQFRSLSYHTLRETDLLDGLAVLLGRQKPERCLMTDGFVNAAELTIGLRSTKPLSDGNNRTQWKRDVRMAMAHALQGDTSAAGQEEGEADFGQFIKNAVADPSILDVQANLQVLTQHIGQVVYGLMSRELSEVDASMTLAGLGVDSLVTIEIRNWWRRVFGVAVSVLELMAAGSIGQLGIMAAEGIKNARIAAASGGA
ncbi:hypothetical protein CDD81_6066 [Ophiocordyceps australis]|uniref:Uncharacterized protein n=1 Tax=Ophiocordyceps australis TaxID=1399860 RepID=A0A2C5X9Q0_9HYPO|nr:hypothetical protein CDD81_6066 [Ophiocordyceps australis]